MIGDNRMMALVVVVVLVVGASVSGIQRSDGINLYAQSSEKALDKISSGHDRSLLQLADDNRVLISIPAETEVTLDLQFQNGTSEQRQYRGPFMQFFELDEVEQISILPSEDVDIELEENSNSNTIILSSHNTKNNSNSNSGAVNQQPTFQTYSMDTPMQMLPGLIVEEDGLQDFVPITNQLGGSGQVFEAPVVGVALQTEPEGSYVMSQEEQPSQLQGAFSTIVSVNVDDRNTTSSGSDFGIPFQPLNSPRSLIDYLTPRTPTLQRGLPNPYNPVPTPPSPSSTQQDNLQQSIYNQFGDLSISLSITVPPISENIDQYQGPPDIFDAMIMSVSGGQNDGAEPVPLQGQDYLQGVIIERDPALCLQMEELVQENGGELFLNAMKVANLDFDTIGDIIVVFLPDSRALERQLLSAGLDLLSPQLSQSQLNSLRKILLYHIVPDVLLLNLASVATPQSSPLTAANQQSFSLGMQQDNIIILQNNDQNQNVVKVESQIPTVACQGFLFTLDSVLIPQTTS